MTPKAGPLYMVTHVQDITARKHFELVLQESEKRYATLFANMTAGMAHCRTVTDERGRPVDYVILQVNEAYERIIGVKKADIEGRRVTEVFPDIRTYALDYIGMYGKIALEGGELHFEEVFEATGQCLSIYAYCPLPGEFAAIFTDATERKRSEAALRESERREHERAEELAAVLEAVPAAVFIAHDPDCRHMTGNHLADEILRIPHGNELSLSAGRGAQAMPFSHAPGRT